MSRYVISSNFQIYYIIYLFVDLWWYKYLVTCIQVIWGKLFCSLKTSHLCQLTKISVVRIVWLKIFWQGSLYHMILVRYNIKVSPLIFASFSMLVEPSSVASNGFAPDNSWRWQGLVGPQKDNPRVFSHRFKVINCSCTLSQIDSDQDTGGTLAAANLHRLLAATKPPSCTPPSSEGSPPTPTKINRPAKLSDSDEIVSNSSSC